VRRLHFDRTDSNVPAVGGLTETDIVIGHRELQKKHGDSAYQQNQYDLTGYGEPGGAGLDGLARKTHAAGRSARDRHDHERDHDDAEHADENQPRVEGHVDQTTERQQRARCEAENGCCYIPVLLERV